MTTNQLNAMNYTQFIAFINQWNVPPGSLDTINHWSTFGHVNSSSNVLEIACTTGLSSREMSRITGCKSTGIDICKDSIESAQMNAHIYGKNLNLTYEFADACTYAPKEKYTHLIIGAALGFFKEPQKFMDRIPCFFDHSGYILASPYYGNGIMPNYLKEKCRKIIGILPTTESYESVRDTYSNFELIYEKRCTIIPETTAQMEKYTRDSINRACALRNITDDTTKSYMYNRLYEIKNVSNELHKYQSYSVMVLRYLDIVYPNKFLELF